MAEIEISPLSERLAEDEVAELLSKLAKHGAPKLPAADEDNTHTVSDAIDDDALVEFLDRLEAHDIACEIYLPIEFESRLEIADLRVGSAQLLLDVLDELRDELAMDEDEDEADDEEDEDEDTEESLLDAKLRVLWKLFHQGATIAMERHLPMHVS